jgi:hypothetical protein
MRFPASPLQCVKLLFCISIVNTLILVSQGILFVIINLKYFLKWRQMFQMRSKKEWKKDL